MNKHPAPLRSKTHRRADRPPRTSRRTSPGCSSGADDRGPSRCRAGGRYKTVLDTSSILVTPRIGRDCGPLKIAIQW